jgi:hypothetical protein
LPATVASVPGKRTGKQKGRLLKQTAFNEFGFGLIGR